MLIETAANTGDATRVLAELARQRGVLLRELASFTGTLDTVTNEDLVLLSRHLFALVIRRALPVVAVDAQVLVPVANRCGLLRLRTAACVDGPTRLRDWIAKDFKNGTPGFLAVSAVVDRVEHVVAVGGQLIGVVENHLDADDLVAIASMLSLPRRIALGASPGKHVLPAFGDSVARAPGHFPDRGALDDAVKSLARQSASIGARISPTYR
ncbi:MAG: hypothetical protein ACRDV4_04165 [Acidimicrobiales bacterium]